MADPISEPRADAEAAVDPSPAAVATTAARALAVGAALATPDALHGVSDDLAAIGISQLPGRWGGWAQRVQIYEASDRILRDYGILAEIREREAEGWVAEISDAAPAREQRVDLWRVVAAEASVPHAVAWLRMLMSDREPIAAAAAANALARWRRNEPIQVPTGLAAARTILSKYSESISPDAQAIARAADDSGRWAESARSPSGPPAPIGASTSLMVHGTSAWAGAWWFMGGDFHSFVLKNVRADLYCGYDAPSWSGRYRVNDRRIAAERLAGWATERAQGQLNTVFAHSYGGTIALMATALGLRIEDLVLLSVPVENIPVEWRNVGRGSSLRIHLDLVLLAARRRQRFTENVDEHYLPRWFWSHSDSHDPLIWTSEDIVKVLQL